MKSKTIVAALTITTAFVASSASATITTYATRATFDAAAGPTTTEGFNTCGSTASLGTNFVLSSSNVGPCGSIVPGISFAPDTGFDLYIAAPGQSANPTGALGVNFPVAGHNIITFALPTSAFAADLFQNFGGGDQSGSDATFTLDVYGVSGLLDSFVFPVASDSGGFYGLTSTAGITSIQISQRGGFAVVDNVSFNSAIPEPASLALMLAGFGMIGALRRRTARQPH